MLSHKKSTLQDERHRQGHSMQVESSFASLYLSELRRRQMWWKKEVLDGCRADGHRLFEIAANMGASVNYPSREGPQRSLFLSSSADPAA